MMNPSDNRMIMSMVAFRTEQIMRDAEYWKVIDPKRRDSGRGVARVRQVIGTGMIRAGARVAGESRHDLPGVQPGV